MTNLLEEIEGAITDEVEDASKYGGDSPHLDQIPGQAQHHIPSSTLVGYEPTYQQQRGWSGYYDSGYGHHAGSSSSYGQMDSPSPALRAPPEAIHQPARESMPPPYSAQPVSSVTTSNHRIQGLAPNQQYYRPAAIPPSLQHDDRVRNGPVQDELRVESLGYEVMVDRLPDPSIVREETGDSSAMKQMQSHGIPLRKTTVLPDTFRRIFKFSYFNAVQSKVFDSVYKTDENLVVSSPTGSGKTVIFELAVLRAVMNKGLGGESQRSLCVYIAPLKARINSGASLALCSEKAGEWKGKLGKIGLKIVEFTGDTASDRGFLHETKNADVIITTPEKWDSVTRRMSQKQKILERLALMMLDEVHILNEQRGAILETVVARMKVSARDMPVRVVALSATIPNVEDVARWLRPIMPNSCGVFEAGGMNPGVASDSNGALQLPMAKVFKFGEDFRPTKLTRIVKGFPVRGDNPFPVINRMIQELFPIICDYSKGKPVLVFAPTRNLCGKAANAVVKAYQAAKDAGRRLPWSTHTRSKMTFENKQLEELSAYGVAFHHGGLGLDDRRKIETAFRGGSIMTIIATSTLAVGVNLPAHTVILAGTYQWTGSGMVDLTDLDVQQMIGRAGRPQYDTEGIAIILCSENNEARYRDLVNSRTTIESCLHEHLTEHINTEIGLRTITCLEEGQEWIRNSFLYVRIQQNPRHYSGILTSTGTSIDRWQETLDRLVANTVEKLQHSEMVQIQESDNTPEPLEVRQISATVYGEAMSANCLSYETMRSILDIPAKASLDSLLYTLSSAHEYADMKLRNGEKLFYKTLAKDPDLRYPLPNGASPTTSAHKVFILIQMTLGNIDWEPYKEQLKQGASGPALDAYNVFRVAPRICKAIATVALQKEDGETLKNALALNRVVSGKAWPNSAVIFRQIDSVGSKSITVLGDRGITTFARLARTDPRQIEMLLNRQTGFGNKIVTAAKGFPEFHVTITQLTQVPATAKAPVDIQFKLEITADGLLAGPSSKKHSQSRTVSVLALLSDGTYVAYRKANARTLSLSELSLALSGQIQYANQKFQVIVGLDQVSGCSTQVECKPDVPDGVLLPPVTNGSEQVEAEEPVPQWKADAESAGQLAAEEDVLDELEMDNVELPPLSNGNWPCSHSCNHKDKCKHICCKEGVKKKPRSTLQKSQLKRNDTSSGKLSNKTGTASSRKVVLTKPAAVTKPTERSKTGYPAASEYGSLKLLGDSESDTEDEKVVINRMLADKDSSDSFLIDLLRDQYRDDSKEFDDPSFDAVLEKMNFNVEVLPTSTRGIKRPSSPTAIHIGNKPVRPQPVKRSRLESGGALQPTTNCDKDFPSTLGLGDATVFSRALQERPQSRKLFLPASDESPSPKSLGKAQDFMPNGLLQTPMLPEMTTAGAHCDVDDVDIVSLGDEDELATLQDLDQFLETPHFSALDNASNRQPMASTVKPRHSSANSASLKGASFLASRSMEESPRGVSSKRPASSTGNTSSVPWRGEVDLSSHKHETGRAGELPSTTKSLSQALDAGLKTNENLRNIGEEPEEDDFLADFDKWVEDGGIEVED